MRLFDCCAALLALTPIALSARVRRQGGPTVALDYATFRGKTVSSVDSFLGMRYAASVADANRLTLPKEPGPLPGVQEATFYGPSCPQQEAISGGSTEIIPQAALQVLESIPLLRSSFGQSEDCLSINVQRPSGIPPDAKLPVAVWIFGGGFELGGTNYYDATGIVQRSVATQQPIIYVSMNYRVSGFGFLPGKEVKAAGIGNLGLHDQRLALRWVQKYIGSFGGDPTKVTIWGESAGSISVALHMLTNGGNTEGLFRAGYMQSGSAIPVGDITRSQNIYDTVVKASGCATAADSLQCLKSLPYAKFKQATDSVPSMLSYSSLHLSYLPRVDGVFLTDLPMQSVLKGQYARIPIINGDCDDEGTLFALTQLNLTTDAQAANFMKSNYAPDATQAEMDQTASLYPSDPRQGAPYDTGYLNGMTPQFKRLASFQGDITFQAPRRFFLDATSKTQPTWSYDNKKLKGLPVLGSFHGSDILQYYGKPTDTRTLDYFLNFVNTMDPNVGGNAKLPVYWPKYGTSNRTLLKVADTGYSLMSDTYRTPQMTFLNQLSLKYPI